MTVVNYSLAVDAIFATFYAAWTAPAVRTLLGYQPVVLWAGVEQGEVDARKYWARVSQQTVLEKQVTLSTCVSASGSRRFETSGLVFVQIFCPASQSDAMEKGRALATIARNAFRGKYALGTRVAFLNVRVNDNLPRESEYIRFNVVAEYEYDEIG